mmetsp:Transcript_38150/g.89480  ORF Transcript_38150/g.89480 Transcript_38150/m.89480 type:complete len:459 (-) Transcript_38150:113-1489(-)
MWTLWALHCALLCILASPIESKRTSGSVQLEPLKAKVVTKFCFDFNVNCDKHNCSKGEHPGKFEFVVHDARLLSADLLTPEVYLALLDDEYFSFPEVSQVWDEGTCEDLKKASKKTFKLNWQNSSSSTGQHITTPLTEHIRPRWWYVAFVSCSPVRLDLAYSIHLQNPRWAWREEFSMDVISVCAILPVLLLAFVGLVAVQLNSMQEWRRRSHAGTWYRLHPALILLTAGALVGLAGQCCWCVHYWRYMSDGQGYETFTILASAGTMIAKTIMSMLLMLLAHGECVCTPDVSWQLHQELMGGLAAFGLLSFGLELWGDSEFRSTTTEYIYDTRPGMVLLAFDVLWLWVFLSRSFQTFRNETRPRPKRFYKTYAPLFALWFAALPAVAAASLFIAPWVRFAATFALTNGAHGLALALLVHTFRPNVATKILELKASEYSAVNTDDIMEMDCAQDDEDEL